MPDANIFETLKICVDGLEDPEKRLFRNLARFLRGEHTREGVMMMLDDWDENHVRGMKVLIGRGFISISDGKFVMHDLVQELAHYISRGEQHNNPHKHSRVWMEDDDVNMITAQDAMKVGRRLSELMQKKLWEAYKANDSDRLRPHYDKSVALGHRSSISHGYEDDEEDGDRRLILVTKEIEKNERMEREILKRLEKGKSKKVEMEVVETLEDRIVNRMEGVIHERMDRFESKVMERLDMLENIVVKRMGMGMEGGVVQRIERLTNLIVDMENPTQATTSQITCTQRAAWIPELTS